MSNDALYLSRAISNAVENVKNSGGPFGAVLVLDNGRVYDGVNRVTENNDPTAHAEVTAIRNACAGEGSFTLEGSGAILYSSCEPCPMCLGAALWSRVDRIVFAANRHDAADGGFDDALFYELLEKGGVAEEIRLDNSVAPFDEWRKNVAKTSY